MLSDDQHSYSIIEFQEIVAGDKFRYDKAWYIKTGRWWGKACDGTDHIVEIASEEVVGVEG